MTVRRLSLNVPPEVGEIIDELAADQHGGITATVISAVKLRQYFDQRAAEGWRPALVKGDVVREIILP